MSNAPVKALRPLLTPRELRDATVRDYTRAAERMGVRVDPAAVERLAVADCELYDRVKRENETAPPSPAKGDERKAERRDVLAETVKDRGATLSPRTVQKRIPILNGNARYGSRWSFALGRLRRIVEGATSHSNPRIATSTCEMPDLAYQVFRLHAAVALRHLPPRPGDEPNPFHGLSDVDFGRKLQRLVEDICDKSSKRLGPWFVPR